MLRGNPWTLLRVSLISIGALLIGYAFWGRSFAYIPVGPVFIGEVVLAIASVCVFLKGGLGFSLASPVAFAWLAFAALGLARTLPFISTYGKDACRDAVIWGYGVFALLVPALLLRSHAIEKIPQVYCTWMRRFIFWAPITIVFTLFFAEHVPFIPGTNVPILNNKGGDVAVHLAGAAAFMLLRLGRVEHREGSGMSVGEVAQWCMLFVTALMVAIATRGGFLAMAIALCIVFLFRSDVHSIKVGLILLLAMLLMLIVNPEVRMSHGRIVSPQHLIDNVASIVGRGDGNPDLNGTRQWRLQWWKAIVDYTFHGPLFWAGKGFGVNLADDDGFQLDQNDHSLRSPHSGNMTILARMGVPGLGLWILLQATFFIVMLRSFFRFRRQGMEWWARLHLWVLAYWAAFLVNGSFDVYLEGPQGGIWFWCVVGYGIALSESHRLFHPCARGTRTLQVRQPRFVSFGTAMARPVNESQR